MKLDYVKFKDSPELKLDIDQHAIISSDTALSRYEVFVNMGGASVLLEAWAAAAPTKRSWTWPDSDGEYNGIVLATVGRDNVSMLVWDEEYRLHSDLGTGETWYALDSFPFQLLVVTTD